MSEGDVEKLGGESAQQHAGPGLGEVISEYRLSSPIRKILSGLLFLTIGTGFCIVAVSSTDGRGPTWLFVAFSVCFLLGGGALVCSAIWTGGRRIILHEKGFVTIVGRTTRVFSFADVVHIEFTEIEHPGSHYGESAYTYRVEVRLRDGVLVFDDTVSDVENLGRELMRAVERFRLLALLTEAIKLEGQGDQAGAAALYAEVTRRSPYNEIGEQARERLKMLPAADPNTPPSAT